MYRQQLNNTIISYIGYMMFLMPVISKCTLSDLKSQMRIFALFQVQIQSFKTIPFGQKPLNISLHFIYFLNVFQYMLTQLYCPYISITTLPILKYTVEITITHY